MEQKAHSQRYHRLLGSTRQRWFECGQDFEVGYMNSIIPHHQDMIAMARMVQNDAPHKEVRDVPAAIIIAQQSELEELTTWLNDWYGQQVNPDPRMKVSQSMMDVQMHADPAMREKHFLAMMREHHQPAIGMGQLVLAKATH